MTTIKVNTITDAAGTGAPNIPDGITIGGVALASVAQMEYTSSASEPSSPSGGALWWDSANELFKMYVNGAWYEVSYTLPPLPFFGSRAVVGGGETDHASGPYLTDIDYYSIPTPSNAVDFGDLLSINRLSSGCSNGSRGIIAGNYQDRTQIQYVTVSTLGNAVDFGDFTYTRGRAQAGGMCDGTYGIFGGGFSDTSVVTADISYITVLTLGNSSVFGVLTAATDRLAGFGNNTYGVFAGGRRSSVSTNVIEYITTATTGNAVDFGDITVARSSTTGTSNHTLGLVVGGVSSNVIDYVTINTPGNATDFGDLIANTSSPSACSDGTYAVINGGYTSTYSNTIQYVTVSTPGNAADFGDLTKNKSGTCSLSGD